MYDILVVNQNYNGDGSANSLTLRRGDLVEVLDQKPINNGTAADKDPSAKWVVYANCYYPFSLCSVLNVIHHNSICSTETQRTDSLLKIYKFNFFSFRRLSFRSTNHECDFSVVFGDATNNNLLDNSAAKHKMSIKPKKTHSAGHLRRSCSPTGNSTDTKYVRKVYI